MSYVKTEEMSIPYKLAATQGGFDTEGDKRELQIFVTL